MMIVREHTDESAMYDNEALVTFAGAAWTSSGPHTQI